MHRATHALSFTMMALVSCDHMLVDHFIVGNHHAGAVPVRLTHSSTGLVVVSNTNRVFPR